MLHPSNPFPDILYLWRDAPTLLRIGVASALLYLAFQQYRRRTEIASLPSKYIIEGVFVPLTVAINIGLGLMFLFGFYTQIASLCSLVVFSKGLWLNYRHPGVVILSNATVLLLMLMSLSLLLTGAGAFAFDVPL